LGALKTAEFNNRVARREKNGAESPGRSKRETTARNVNGESSGRRPVAE
jgi:hypothetical protein